MSGQSLQIQPGKYLIAGASGLVGFHLLKLLKNQPGVEVIAASNSRITSVTGQNITAVQANLMSVEYCDTLLANIDYVIAAAGVVASAPVLFADPVTPIRINLQLAINILEAAWRQRVKHLVWISSTTAYPEGDDIFCEADMFTGEPPEKWWGIGNMTRFVEQYAKYIAKQAGHEFAVTTLRPSMIYGENDHFSDKHAHFVPALLRRVVERKNPVEIWGDGQQRRDLVHAEDVAIAALLTLSRNSDFRAYNIAAERCYSVKEVLDLLCELDGFENVNIQYRADKPQSSTSRRFSAQLITYELGFKPKIDLREGLQRTLIWYRTRQLASLEN